jgi:uncharacterized protein YbaR (Trm112 family)
VHILLTDLLTCPRCGPGFGLLVLSDRLEERRVEEGRLGCPNCRHSYPIRGGVADLRHLDSPPLELADGAAGGEAAEPVDERAFRAAALLGVTAPNAAVMVVETAGSHATAVAETLSEVHVIGCSPEFPASRPITGVLSQVVCGQRLPFRSAAIHGAAVLAAPPPALIDEVRRVLLPGARLVVDRTPPGLAGSLRSAGFEVLLEQDGVTVAAAPAAR